MAKEDISSGFQPLEKGSYFFFFSLDEQSLSSGVKSTDMHSSGINMIRIHNPREARYASSLYTEIAS
jgi:hypothetical protein